MKKFVVYRHVIIAAIACIVIFGAFIRSKDEQFGRTGVSLSMKELIDTHTTQMCKFTSLSPVVDTEGVVYVSDGVLRGDFESTRKSASGGRVVTTHMIVDRGYSYIWSQLMSGVGIKIALATMKEDASTQEGGGDSALFDVDRKLDMRCEPWSKNVSLFTRPKGVTFQDMSGVAATSVAPSLILGGK